MRSKPCPTPTQNDAARPGWTEFLRREFDADVRNVNREILAIEAAGEKLDETASVALHLLKLQEIGSSHLVLIGSGATPAIRAKVWDKLLSGELPLTWRRVSAEVKQLNSGAGKTTLKVQAPTAPAPAPTLPKPKPGKGLGSKLSRSKYGDLPERVARHRAHTRQQLDPVPCLHCGASFQPQRSTAKFCSAICRAAAHRAANPTPGSSPRPATC